MPTEHTPWHELIEIVPKVQQYRTRALVLHLLALLSIHFVIWEAIEVHNLVIQIGPRR